MSPEQRWTTDDQIEAFGERLTRSRFLRRTGAAAFGLAAGGSLLTGRASLAATATTAAETAQRSLSMALFQPIDTLDPAGTSLVAVGQILPSIFDPLIWYIPGRGGADHVPGLAESYTVSKDATTYTFKLRQGVTFHDGTKFDAAAVKATFDHIVNPATKAKSELGSLGPYKESRVIDSHTVQIVFSHPNAAFVNEMSTIYISSPAALKKYGAHYGTHPVGTGPFIFKEYVPGSYVRVERNPGYHWGPRTVRSGPALLSEITFRILPEPAAQYSALQTGEIQLVQSLAPTDVVAATKSGRFRKFVADAAGLPYSMVLNTGRAPTDDVRVRQALSYATDKQMIIQTLYQGLFSAAGSLLTPATIGFQPSQNLYPYNPGKAQKLLDAAGWRRKGGGTRSKDGKQLSLSIINASGFGFDGISQIMQSQFAQLGIHSVISDQAFPAVNATYEKGVMNLSNWFYSDVDPSFLQVLFTCGNIGGKGTGFNDAFFCRLAVDRQLSKAAGEPNQRKRAALYNQIVHTLMSEAVAIPIYNLRYIYVGPSTMKGLAFTRDGSTLFHAVTY